jgi:hypothetical protein
MHGPAITIDGLKSHKTIDNKRSDPMEFRMQRIQFEESPTEIEHKDTMVLMNDI